MAAIGKAEENGYAEHVLRTIKEEEVSLAEYFGFAGAACQISHFIGDVCKNKRILHRWGIRPRLSLSLPIGSPRPRMPKHPPKKPPEKYPVLWGHHNPFVINFASKLISL